MGENALRISRRIFLGGAAAFGITAVVSPTFAFATPTAAEKQAEADEVRGKVKALKDELVEKSNVYGAALDEHDAAVVAMEQAQSQIEEKSTEVAHLQDRLGTRVKGMYRSGSVSFIDILFASATFEEFVTNWDMLNHLNEDDAQMVEETKVLREELQAAYDEYEKQEEIAAQKTEEARIAKEEVESSAVYYEELLSQLDAETLQLLAAEEEAAAVAAAAAAAAAAQPAIPVSTNDSQASSPDPESSEAPAPSDNNPARDYGPPAGDVLTEAQKYLGMNYVYGSADPSNGGFDCSGLVYYCHLRCGRAVPPRSTYGYGGNWFPVSEAQPGDILWQPEHVGICASPGGGSYIHAADYGSGVCWSSYPQFQRAYRF